METHSSTCDPALAALLEEQWQHISREQLTPSQQEAAWSVQRLVIGCNHVGEESCHTQSCASGWTSAEDTLVEDTLLQVLHDHDPETIHDCVREGAQIAEIWKWGTGSTVSMWEASQQSVTLWETQEALRGEHPVPIPLAGVLNTLRAPGTPQQERLRTEITAALRTQVRRLGASDLCALLETEGLSVHHLAADETRAPASQVGRLEHDPTSLLLVEPGWVGDLLALWSPRSVRGAGGRVLLAGTTAALRALHHTISTHNPELSTLWTPAGVEGLAEVAGIPDLLTLTLALLPESDLVWPRVPVSTETLTACLRSARDAVVEADSTTCSTTGSD